MAASEQNGNIADHVTGNASGKILFIEYGDYQCPSCGGAYTNVKSILEEYGNDITFIFRNFPLTTVHPNARAAAAAAEAAGLQGKFWEMHDKLYEGQSDWENLDGTKRTNMFKTYATSLGLDVSKFESDLSAKQVTQKINFDLAVGKAVDVNATPTFFLNGEKLDDKTSSGIVQSDLTDIKAKLDSLIKK
ncbi:hypothetical protein BGO18_04490 [Candidatus Saccharibacteria bacterium 47-87]|nr:MAG: hypothetical protein BGO18_04490 [Candidatus Saccharibacteria bacterium 47-87]